MIGPGVSVVKQLIDSYMKIPKETRISIAGFYTDLSPWMRRTSVALHEDAIPQGLSTDCSIWMGGLSRLTQLQGSLLQPRLLDFFPHGVAGLINSVRGGKGHDVTQILFLTTDLLQLLMSLFQSLPETGPWPETEPEYQLKSLHELADELDEMAGHLDAWAATLRL